MKQLLGWIVCCAYVQNGIAADLMTVYERARSSDPQLREAEARRLAALEAKPQAIAQLLPQISYVGMVSRERDTGLDNTTEPATSGAAGAPVILETFPFDGRIATTTYHYGVQLRQNLFRWENWVALKRANVQVAQAEADYQAAQQDLIERVAERYFNVLAAEDGLEAQQGALASVGRQLDQAQGKWEVGLIAVTDVEEARASHDSTVAAVIAAERSVASARGLLREITGDAVDSLARPIEPFELTSPDPIGEDRWVNMALQQNLSLVSSRLAAEIAEENSSAARGAHLPTLDAIASISRQKVDGTFTFADGNPAGGMAVDKVQRSIGLQLSVPIYSGGLASSLVRQTGYEYCAAKERRERVARQTERDTRDAYSGVLLNISRVKALRRAVESSTNALQVTEAAYEVGTRTTLEVLQTRQQWVQAQTDYSRSRYDYMINVIKLQQSAGILSMQGLSSLNDLFKESSSPGAHGNELSTERATFESNPLAH
jgi:outer membrane protein